jgi:hypothetical protein
MIIRFFLPLLLFMVCVSISNDLRNSLTADSIATANNAINTQATFTKTDHDPALNSVYDLSLVDSTIDPVFDPDNLIATFDQDCIVKCSNDSTDDYACYTDGYIYPNICLAVCQNSQNYEDFKCDPLSLSECNNKCLTEFSKRKCKLNCSIIAETRIVSCFSPGILNIDICRSKCESKDSELLFKCSDIYLKNQNCWQKCIAYASAMSDISCNSSSQKFVCASDGLIYSGDCRAILAGQTVLSNSDDKGSASKKLCYFKSTQKMNSHA